MIRVPYKVCYSQVNPSKRTEESMVGKDKLANHSTEADKDNTLEKQERVCFETKIIGGAVVRVPVRKVRNVDICELDLAKTKMQSFLLQ